MNLQSAIKRIFTIVPVDTLTERQGEVLGLLAIGMTDAEIALLLGVDTSTVKSHISQVYQRLGLQMSNGNPRVLAALYVIRAGVSFGGQHD